MQCAILKSIKFPIKTSEKLTLKNYTQTYTRADPQQHK